MILRFEKVLLLILIIGFGMIPPLIFLIFYDVPSGIKGTAVNTIQLEFRDSSSFEQLAAVATAFFIKPLYTILAFIVFVLLWKKSEPELKALKWSMIFFFVGENFCAANYLFTVNHDAHLLEYFHSLGMVLSFAFATFALFEGIDRYAIRYSEPNKKCSFSNFCRRCSKYEAVSCGLQSFLISLGIAGALVALMPLSAHLHGVSYNTEIWGTLYNYKHPIIYQLFEVRYYPLLASGLFFAASLLLWLKREAPWHPSKMLFAAASGTMGFSFFRFIVFQGYRPNLVWMNFWEEITEFIFILIVILGLWFFRRSIFENGLKSDIAVAT